MKDDYEILIHGGIEGFLGKQNLGWKSFPAAGNLYNPALYGSLDKIEEEKQAAADVLYQYSKFVMACIGNQARPCDMRLHLMKEVSGLPTYLKKEPSHVKPPPDVMGESSSSGTSRIVKSSSFGAL